MPGKSRPWYWPERKIWCVQIDRRRHVLGEHPTGAKKPKRTNGKWNVPREIEDAFHKLMASPDHKPSVSEGIVAYVLDAALTWTYENRAKSNGGPVQGQDL